MITIFSSPKPFEGHIDIIQRNAIRSWQQLGPEVQILLIGDEPGLGEAAAELRVDHLADVERNQRGTPTLDSIFALARRAANHTVLCYVNADIIFLDDLLPAVSRITDRLQRYLVVGQRWDLEVRDKLQFQNGWVEDLRSVIYRRGQRHPPAGSDYFIFPRSEFEALPPFALGRSGWDNWMIYAARRRRVPVVDASMAITAVHQDHDYSHLPGGQPHYRLPESEQNISMAGGRVTVFTIKDATWSLDDRGLKRSPLGRAGFLRNLEAVLLARLGPGRPANAVRRFFRWLTPLDNRGNVGKSEVRP